MHQPSLHKMQPMTDNLNELLDDIAREYLHPELARAGIENPERYTIRYDMTPLDGNSVADQLAAIAAMFKLAAETTGELALAHIFALLGTRTELIEADPELMNAIGRVYQWLEEDK